MTDSANPTVVPPPHVAAFAPKFEAPAGKYEWLSKDVFVGAAEKTPAGDRIHDWEAP